MWPGGSERRHGVGNSEHPGAEGNLLTFEAERITRTIPPLVMVPDQSLASVHVWNGPDPGCTPGRMTLNLLPHPTGEDGYRVLPGTFRKADHPHVREDGTEVQVGQILLGEPEVNPYLMGEY